MRKIGINLIGSDQWNDETFIKTAAAMGFSTMFSGVMEESRQMHCAELMAKEGIEYETLHAPFNGINSIWLEGSAGDEMLKRLTDCVDRCVQVSAPIAVVHLSSGMNPPSITDIGRERFARLVEYAGEKNVKIAFENQRKLANLAWAMEAFGPENSVGFCWDCGHESCYTPGHEYMPFFGNRLICTHIHDNMGIFDQDDHMLPFDGTINYNRFAEHINHSGYTGSLMLEVFCANKLYTGMSLTDFLTRAATAAKHLAGLCPAPAQGL